MDILARRIAVVIGGVRIGPPFAGLILGLVEPDETERDCDKTTRQNDAQGQDVAGENEDSP